jgi:hypothetical protein
LFRGWKGTYPIINFLLIGKKNSIKLNGLVDTGAYYTTMHSYYADEAGIDLTKAQKEIIESTNGKIEGKKVNVYLKLIDNFTNENISIKTDVVFIDNLKLNKEAVIIGREGIFNKFKEISFSENTQNKNVKFKF